MIGKIRDYAPRSPIEVRLKPRVKSVNLMRLVMGDKRDYAPISEMELFSRIREKL